MRFLSVIITVPFLCQCTSLTKPGAGRAIQDPTTSAKTVLQQSAKAHGDPWKKYRTLEVKFDGEWAPVVDRIQPEIVDASFRKKSTEVYHTQKQSVQQTHTGPDGVKFVQRTPGSIAVTYNGKPNRSDAQNAASALVADGYVTFVFGSSWLNENAKDLQLLSARYYQGQRYYRIQGKLIPGLGFAKSDHFIAWIDEQSKLLRRLQFTLKGVSTTQGADVSTTFSNFKKAKDGTIWPTLFVERIARPIPIKAHEWYLLSLKADGKLLLGN